MVIAGLLPATHSVMQLCVWVAGIKPAIAVAG
jgi:hypothetical protein